MHFRKKLRPETIIQPPVVMRDPSAFVRRLQTIAVLGAIALVFWIGVR